MIKTRKALVAGSAILCSTFLLMGCSVPSDENAPREGEGKNTVVPKGQEGTALAALEKLQVKGRAPMTNYDRDQFGSAWDDSVGDFDWTKNGCDTRNDVLQRDLVDIVFDDGSDCDVDKGVLPYDPYSGETNYVFDSTDDVYETDLDIEHVVALGNAWSSGAEQLSEDQRARLANDPINLMAVNPSLNRAKSDADFATWLPPNKAFRCSYAARQIRVKTVYKLSVTKAEKAAMEKVLTTCPDEPLVQPDPQAGDKPKGNNNNVPPAPAPTETPDAKPTPKPDKPKGTKPPENNDVFYENCDAVRAAGAAPIRKGDPGYSRDLDRDGDGSACE